MCPSFRADAPCSRPLRPALLARFEGDPADVQQHDLERDDQADEAQEDLDDVKAASEEALPPIVDAERRRSTSAESPVVGDIRPSEASAAHDRRINTGDGLLQGFVFASAQGSSMNASKATHAFQAELAKAGLPRQRFHDLRHAFATLQLEDGDELGVISRMLGHANVSTHRQ
jgi:hypothetical protein